MKPSTASKIDLQLKGRSSCRKRWSGFPKSTRKEGCRSIRGRRNGRTGRGCGGQALTAVPGQRWGRLELGRIEDETRRDRTRREERRGNDAKLKETKQNEKKRAAAGLKIGGVGGPQSDGGARPAMG